MPFKIIPINLSRFISEFLAQEDKDTTKLISEVNYCLNKEALQAPPLNERSEFFEGFEKSDSVKLFQIKRYLERYQDKN